MYYWIEKNYNSQFLLKIKKCEQNWNNKQDVCKEKDINCLSFYEQKYFFNYSNFLIIILSFFFFSILSVALFWLVIKLNEDWFGNIVCEEWERCVVTDGGGYCRTGEKRGCRVGVGGGCSDGEKGGYDNSERGEYDGREGKEVWYDDGERKYDMMTEKDSIMHLVYLCEE